MKYYSTRNASLEFTFEETILKGYASDGGLILPLTIPQVTTSTLRSWSNYSYPDVVLEVLKHYIDPIEIPHFDLKRLIKNAFKNFPLEPVKIVSVGDGSLKVAELFHGPTMAFKDLSVACLGQFMEYFLQKRGKRATVTVATSGDTGGSVVQNLKGLSNIDVIVMYPKGRCNETQVLHMTTTNENNIHCFEVEGTSDDEDLVMTTVHADTEFSKRHNLTVANSINWGRMLVQVANYFYIYLRSGVTVGDKLQIIVPTGGAGSAMGGCIAYRMGLPVALCLATNSNDCINQFIHHGRILVSNEPVKKTFASAMDIQVPYNLERLLTMFANDVKPRIEIVSLLKDFFSNGKDLNIQQNLLAKIKEVIVGSYSVDDDQILATIHRCWKENNYKVCPHTATALACFYGMTSIKKRVEQIVCIATASPKKFPEVLEAAGLPYDEKDIELLRLKKQNSAQIDSMLKEQDWVNILRKKIENITSIRENK